MSQAQGPRIGIIGTGAIGGFYGVMLARAGFDVHFLLRSEYDAVVRDGLQVNSAVHGPLKLQPVQAYRDVARMPACDWLLVGAKTTSNVDLAPLIAQAAAPGAKVLLMQNGLGVEDALRPLLPDTLHLLGGLCFICVHRQAPGVVEHEAQGAVNVAYHSGPAADAAARKAVVEEGVGLFRAAGVGSTAMDNLDQARWQKLVWNMPYNGLSVLLNSGTKGLMADAGSRALIEAMMNEVVEGAAACGHALPEGLAGKMLVATQHMQDYLPSMYHDYREQRPMELHAIYAEPLAAALANGKDLPRLRMLHQALAFLDARNAG
ncbi:putative 2-dehydropantoate 2-reductase [Pseudomonas mangrovi]|uniref:2-dehydropantoate 2-reductase n=1 Tax=Pseudomonas mangrovi TaxID=2161748 RepID=A0A2T5P7G4_9PSED|nr:putative 2-dehydropantoate 2-reductase [Pseudomonas mangrovi]PTU73644.1 putative 2-dehydropantoate 2-reductase [Pseudomonas mangrovi]